METPRDYDNEAASVIPGGRGRTVGDGSACALLWKDQPSVAEPQCGKQAGGNKRLLPSPVPLFLDGAFSLK